MPLHGTNKYGETMKRHPVERIVSAVEGAAMSIVQRLLDTAQMRTQYPEWLCAEMEAAAEEIMRLRKDAERYRWLRDKALDVVACWERGGQQEPWCVIGTCADDAVPCSGTELDAAIDAAMNGANT